jgi:putative copper export protein
MDLIILWLFRAGHVLAATTWVGGYTLFTFVLVPLLAREASIGLLKAGVTTIRVMTYSGIATIFFGLLLVTRTRGFTSINGGEWGLIVLTCIVIAIILLGIGDGALRPQLRRLAQGKSAPRLQQIAVIGFTLSALAIMLMTRAIYARS